MKFRCERDVLLEALSVAGRAVGTRGGSLLILHGVLARLVGDELTLTGTDLDLTISMKVTVAGEEDGVAVLTSKLVSDIVRHLEPGAVSVSVSDEQASISGGRSEFSLRIMAPDDFPQVTTPEGEPVVLPAADLASALKQVVPAASTDPARPIITGVLATAEEAGLRLVATDSYRLSMRDMPGTTLLDQGSVLVPARALSELTRQLGDHEEVSLRLGEQDASFQVGNVLLTTRLIKGDFPNYKGLIPSEHPNRLTVNREAVLDAVRRVRLMAREATPIRLIMTENSLELRAITQDVGEAHEQLDADYSGEELTVAFNPEYLMDGLEVTPGDEVTLETIDPHKPALLRMVGSQDFLYLLMPVRVS